jgi:hypothetical protein
MSGRDSRVVVTGVGAGACRGIVRRFVVHARAQPIEEVPTSLLMR